MFYVDIPVPSLVNVEPSLHVFAGEAYSYIMSFDEPITLVQAEAVEVTLNGEKTVLSVTSLDATTLQFIYTAPNEGTAVFELKKEMVKDDLQRVLPSDVQFTRIVEGACGPSYLASLSQEAGVCRCRRSVDKCECQCGDLGASMDY